MNRLEVNLFGHKLSNPIAPASGTFGFGYEFADYYDINVLGTIALKGTTAQSRYGNPHHRIADCPAGMLNAIGLQNPGVDHVISDEIPKLKAVYKKPVIANVGGHSYDEYINTVAKFNDCDTVMAIELNISCPNVAGGGMVFGIDPKIVYELTREVKSVSTKPIIVKLSPNVADITLTATAAERGGADAISLINTLVGMRIDLMTGMPVLAVKTGGYSGPGIFPIALRMVYSVYHAVNIPVIGMGGITNARDVLEMMYAGASVVMIGTQNLIDPFACKKIISQLPTVMDELGINNISDIVGRTQ
jgi:dihydroorotate dehydrogenase (NAD+) catalytic subunit